jgi:hypothetical protein
VSTFSLDHPFRGTNHRRCGGLLNVEKKMRLLVGVLGAIGQPWLNTVPVDTRIRILRSR